MTKFERMITGSIAVAVLGLSGCGDSETLVNRVPAQDISKNVLEAAASKRIVFAHQSVGRDLLQGVRALSDQLGVPISILETRKPPSSGPGIYHFRVGKNRDPQGKISDYLSAFESIGESGADVAVMKLCYVDFNRDTNAHALADEYLGAIRTLQSKHPQIRFVGMTSPLTTVEVGPKAMLKKLIGKTPDGYTENALRQQFNERLRSVLSADQLFDIAALESSAVASEPVVVNGQPVETLPQALTYDGGHLTEEANRMVAASFLKFISEQPTGATATQQGDT